MLEVKHIHRRLGDFYLQDINIHVGEGEYFVLSGPSGAGKTVLFEIIAGIVDPGSGNVILDGKDITCEKIQHRDIGLVFQDGAVFPHLKVRENIAFALKHKGFDRARISAEVGRIAGELSITHLLDRRPSTLSGGELQRVAIARTLVLNPKCLLLDEPLSSLDIQLKEDIRSLLRNLNRKGLTILHITHEFNEAFALAGRIAVMDHGQVVQIGTPQEIYGQPATPFVASFAGRRNFFSLSQVRKDLPRLLDETAPTTPFIIIPDHAIEIIDNGNSRPDAVPGRVVEVNRYPHRCEIKIDCGLIIHKSIYTQSKDEIIPLQDGEVNIIIIPEKVLHIPSGTPC